jgi:hypothetical protein
MERGRNIAERAKRHSDLHRLQEGKKVKVMVALPGHAYYEPTGRVNLFYVEDVQVAHQNELADDYPSEPVMAMIQLAVSATVGYEGVPDVSTISPEERERRDRYRNQMGRQLARSAGNA